MRQLYCTAIIKVTFDLAAQGLMERVNPAPIRRGDDYFSGVPSLAGASEIAPQMLEADVTIVGHAYANPRAKKRSVRFTMVRGDNVLIDKTLYVYGNRVKGGAPKPFRRMRIGYERALGGLAYPKNPIGVGVDKDSTRRPNIIDPKRPKARAAGFGPYPARFLRRRQYRGEVPLELIEGGIAEYPDDFEWKYFQASPRDQRVPQVKGNEWLLLEGLHPDHDRIRARLPHARAFCRVYQRKDVSAPEMVDMRGTMLHLEPDDDRCSLVYRGHFPIASELAAKELVLAGAVQCGRELLVWPAHIGELSMMASPAPPSTTMKGAKPSNMMETAVSQQGREQPAQRNLGRGYRLGEQKVALAAAPPAPIEELRPEDLIEDVPPEMPYSDIPPPPSWRGRASAAGAPSWAQAIEHGVPPPPPPVPMIESYPNPHLPSSAVYSSPQSSEVYGHPHGYGHGYGHQYAQQPAVEEEHPLSSTDEMEDPEGEAAADAGLNAYDETVQMADPDEDS